MPSFPGQLTVTESWTDVESVHQLWTRAIGSVWPIRTSVLAATLRTPIIDQTGLYVAAYQDKRLIGFACVQLNTGDNSSKVGNIQYLIVDPAFQRRGIGRAIIDTILTSLQASGVAKALAGGRYPRLWPGIPDNLPNALAFFQALDWNTDRVEYDLGRMIRDYRIPVTITARIAMEGVVIEPANSDDIPLILALNDREFAGWAKTYHYVIGLGDIQDVLVARDQVKGIVGSLIMYGPESNPDRIDADWRDLHGEAVGGLGEVGVIESERKRGLGLALVARGTEVLQARGVNFAHIGFTSLTDFYGKLEYVPWQKYRTGARQLSKVSSSVD